MVNRPREMGGGGGGGDAICTDVLRVLIDVSIDYCYNLFRFIILHVHNSHLCVFNQLPSFLHFSTRP